MLISGLQTHVIIYAHPSTHGACVYTHTRIRIRSFENISPHLCIFQTNKDCHPSFMWSHLASGLTPGLCASYQARAKYLIDLPFHSLPPTPNWHPVAVFEEKAGTDYHLESRQAHPCGFYVCVTLSWSWLEPHLLGWV